MKAIIRNKWAKRLATIALCIALLGAFLAYLHTAVLVGDRIAYPQILTLPASELAPPRQPHLRIMTLNAAHGRKDGPHQIFQSGATIEANLDDVAAALRQIEPDVVGLQEADGPSLWSGDFDHVQYLAEGASFQYSVLGEHAQALWLTNGTAVLSRLPLDAPLALTFPPSPPSSPKGFILVSVEWPDSSGTMLDVVSVHLDWSRQSVRDEQVAEMIRVLSQRENPLVVMGDFNTDWLTPDSCLRKLARELHLEAYEPESPGYVTYPPRNSRYDWILISGELEFATYQIVTDRISDHLGIVSEIVLRERAR